MLDTRLSSFRLQAQATWSVPRTGSQRGGSVGRQIGTTLNIVFSVTNSICLAQYSFGNHPYSVTNTKCKHDIVCHSLYKNLGNIDVQCYNLRSLAKCLAIQIFIILDHISLSKKKQVARYTKLCINNWHLDELRVSWDDSICELIHKKCHSYHIAIKYHVTLNTIFSVVMSGKFVIAWYDIVVPDGITSMILVTSMVEGC